ncbi:unnamed protein product [Tetraodon nigroviridis]|uniref:(spotted green pufferfish) hypothetical protein n=1 Tax=Tetraodon nigroviridis TaxID=99883 RepID=Q4S7R3_TETNG|nr:unnamed protein product [Tetraodon nigroviridis]
MSTAAAVVPSESVPACERSLLAAATGSAASRQNGGTVEKPQSIIVQGEPGLLQPAGSNWGLFVRTHTRTRTNTETAGLLVKLHKGTKLSNECCLCPVCLGCSIFQHVCE